MSEALRIPAPAAQGPGALPRPAVDRLALGVARRAAGVLNGATPAPGQGDGTELEQLRPYQHGDDVRWLDPAASARTGVPHVRRYVPERALTTWIVLDVSPSMAWGTAQRLKSDVAAGAAQVLADLGVRHAGQVGLVACGGPEPVVLPPRGGRAALVALQRHVAAGVVPDGAGRPDALADGLRRLGAIARRPGLVAVVSDLPHDAELRRPLAALAERHTVLAVEVRDPRELALPPVRRLALVDPETGEHAEVDVDDGVRERFAARVAGERREVRDLLRRLGALHVVLSTDAAWLPDLARRLT
ncbi:MAG: DUF58 domain-containing protein [Solirubrobacterales bacterium]|nr:DUF58 domain-containing protein [Solirubrobacterales bacterium]